MDLSSILMFTLLVIPLVNILALVVFTYLSNKKVSLNTLLCTCCILFGIMATVVAIIMFHYSIKNYSLSSLATINLFRLSDAIYISFHLEVMSLIFGTLVCLLWPLTMLYSLEYMSKLKKNNYSQFYIFFTLSIFATLGVTFSANLLTTFIFYELLTFFTYPLVTYNNPNSIETKKAGKIYLYTLFFTSMSFLLLAIIMTTFFAGTTFYTNGGLVFNATNNQLILLFLFFMLGLSKSAIAPFHFWLPEAMVAPTPVSALLHAVAVVKVGVFVLLKVIVYIFGLNLLNSIVKNSFFHNINLFLIIPLVTILMGSLLAYKQEKIKKLLAYSTISNLSYIIGCALLFTKIAIIASIFHIITHALGKILLFFCAGIFNTFLGKENINDLNNIGKKYPILILLFLIGSFSLIGFPFTLGFISKWYIFKAIIEKNNYTFLIVMCISSTLSLMYFLPIVFKAFFTEEKNDKIADQQANESKKRLILPISLVIPMLIIAAIICSLFFVSVYIMNILNLVIG